MKQIFEDLGYEFVGRISDILCKQANKRDLSSLNKYDNKKGIIVFTEGDEIIYVGRSTNIKERIGHLTGEKKDTASLKYSKNLDEQDQKRLSRSNIYVHIIDENEFKKNTSNFCKLGKER